MRLLMIIAGLLTGFGSSARQLKPYTISGTITGKDTGYLCLTLTDLFERRTQDTAVIRNGKFVFKGEIPYTVMAFIMTSDAKSAGDPNYSYFLLDPGNTRVLLQYGDFKKRQLSGSVTQASLDSLEKLKAGFSQEKSAKTDLDFITAHPDSYLSAYLLRSRIAGLHDGEKGKWFNALSMRIQQSGFGKAVKYAIDRVAAGLPGMKAPDFTANDIKGNKLSLSEFKGKYVLIDFWASWCIPCRRGNPHLLNVYAKYKSRGFEIIGVSDDDSRPDAWYKAVEKDSIGVWRHVLRGLDLEKVKAGNINFDTHPNEISSSKYGIAALPTKILVDPSGIIIGRYGSDEEALDRKLAEIFK